MNLNSRFTIITPTLQRQSLIRCCESVDLQVGGPYEHVVVLDCAQMDAPLLRAVAKPHRAFSWCVSPHRNWGNTCRHNGWNFASGDWLLYLDDDNYLADQDILHDMALALANVSYWAIFPMLRHGRRFFNDPPDMCMTDTGNVVVRRSVGRWPDTNTREADGMLVQRLRATYPYQAFPNFRPVIVMEQSSGGV